MSKNDLPTQQAQFLELLQQAKAGNTTPLNRFFKKLYEKGKVSLLKLTKSEELAEEYFQVAVTKFWTQCVEGKKALPNSNIEGYIYSMARFHCIDQMRKQSRQKVDSKDTSTLANQTNLSENMVVSVDQTEEAELQQLRRTVMYQMIKQLSENCQKLFKAILEESIEKPKQLMIHLGLKEVRRVSVLKHECYKRLRVLTAAALEVELARRV
ncbi:MAG: sigma-70 family RNA polymerase sigma factor [Bacteroidota bacterium]